MDAVPDAAWTVTEASGAERPLVERLVQLYLHDFSEFDGAEVGEDGRFTDLDDDMDGYWTEPNQHPLVVRVAGKPAGFALIHERGERPGDADRHWMGEFFVMRAYRRRGYGEAMARAIFDRYPGPWQVAQVRENLPAQAFWRRVIDVYTGGRYTERQTPRGSVLQEFDTRDRGGVP